MLPRIIHQIWIGPNPRPNEWLESWKVHHPQWRHMLWDEATIAAEFPDGLCNQAAFDAMRVWDGRADILRYEAIHKYGGVYVDADMECMRPVDDVIGEPFVLTAHPRYSVHLANGLFGFHRGDPFVRTLMERIHETPLVDIQMQDAWRTTGPLLLSEAYLRQRPEVRVLQYYDLFHDTTRADAQTEKAILNHSGAFSKKIEDRSP